MSADCPGLMFTAAAVVERSIHQPPAVLQWVNQGLSFSISAARLVATLELAMHSLVKLLPSYPVISAVGVTDTLPSGLTSVSALREPRD